MITLTMQAAGWRVESINATDEQGESITMRVLVLVDPHSGISIHVPFVQPVADEVAASLRGKPHIAVASPVDVPKVRG